MELKPLKKQGLAARVSGYILDEIRAGRIKAGEKIYPQRKFARDLDVSMGAIREALNALALANIVVVKPGKGTFISDLSFKDIFNPTQIEFKIDNETIKDLLELRIVFEVMAMKLVCEKASDEDLEKIGNIVEKEVSAVRRQDLKEYINLNYDFHMEIIKSAHNKVLEVIYRNTVTQLTKRIEKAIKKKKNMDIMHNAHKDIYQYLKVRDAGNASKIMEEHVKESAKLAL